MERKRKREGGERVSVSCSVPWMEEVVVTDQVVRMVGRVELLSLDLQCLAALSRVRRPHQPCILSFLWHAGQIQHMYFATGVLKPHGDSVYGY